MSHKLNDITLYYHPSDDSAKKFTMKQNLISDLYVNFLTGYKPPKTSRISVTLCSKDSIQFYSGSILMVDAFFNKDQFWKLNDREQNIVILDTIHRVALLCVEKYHWNKAVFEQAYDKVLKADFNYEIEGILKSSKNRQHKASVLLKKNELFSTIFAVFYDNEGKKIKTVELLKSFPHAMFYGGILNNYKWFNNSEFGIYSSGEELSIRASLENDLSETVIKPKLKEKEVIEGILRSITYRQLSDERDFVEWANG